MGVLGAERRGHCGNDHPTYFGKHHSRHFADGLPREDRYQTDVINTWGMTVQTPAGIFEGGVDIELPERL